MSSEPRLSSGIAFSGKGRVFTSFFSCFGVVEVSFGEAAVDVGSEGCVSKI